MVQKHLRDKGVTLHLEESVREIRPHDGDDHALEVVTGRNVLPADLVITAVGEVPIRSWPARRACWSPPGAASSSTAAFRPPIPYLRRRRLHRQPPPHYRQIRPLPFRVPRQPPGTGDRHQSGRGLRDFQRHRRLLHVKGLRTGRSRHRPQSRRARQEGFDAVGALVIQADRAHFYPTQDLMYLHLVADKKTRASWGPRGSATTAMPWWAASTASPPFYPSRPTLPTCPTWKWPTPRPSPPPWISSTPWPTPWKTSWTATTAPLKSPSSSNAC